MKRLWLFFWVWRVAWGYFTLFVWEIHRPILGCRDVLNVKIIIVILGGDEIIGIPAFYMSCN
jgi:hypothetical protein